MIVQLAGQYSATEDAFVFDFERGFLQQLIEKEKLLNRKNVGRWWTKDTRSSNDDDWHYQVGKRIKLDNSPSPYPPTVAVSLLGMHMCDNQTHSHLSAPKEQRYPTAENYHASIAVSRTVLTAGPQETYTRAPIASELENQQQRFKRDATQSNSADDSDQFQLLRDLALAIPPLFTLDNTAQQINVRGYFGVYSGLGYIKRNPNHMNLLTLAQELVQIVSSSLNGPFGSWPRDQLTIEIIGLGTDGQTVVNTIDQAKKAKLKIMLPPHTKFTTNSPDLWSLWGFTKKSDLHTSNSYSDLPDNIVRDLSSNQFTGFDNSASSDKTYYVSTSPFDLLDTYQSATPSQHFLFKFSRFKSAFSSQIQLEEGLLMSDHPAMAPLLFTEILKNSVQRLDLHPHCLTVTSGDNINSKEFTLQLNDAKKHLITLNPTAKYPLTFDIQLSDRLVQVLKLAQPSTAHSITTDTTDNNAHMSIRWQPDVGPLLLQTAANLTNLADISIKQKISTAFASATFQEINAADILAREGFNLKSANPEENPSTAAEVHEKETAFTKRLEALNALKTRIMTSEAEQRYSSAVALLKKLTDQEAKFRRDYLITYPSLTNNLNNIKTTLRGLKIIGTKDRLKLTPLSSLSSKIDNSISKLNASGDSISDSDFESAVSDLTTEIDEALKNASGTLDDYEIRLKWAETALTNFIDVELVKAMNTPLTPNSTTTPAEIVANASADGAVSSITSASDSTVIIHNPEPARGNSFVVFQSNDGVDVCSSSTSNTPNDYLLVIEEGDPKDFISTKGFCSILGSIRTSSSPKIITNTCTISNAHNLNKLKIKIISSSFGTYKPAANKKTFMSLTLRISSTDKK